MFLHRIYDPSLHQMEVPGAKDVLMHATICIQLQLYRLNDPWFDFKKLMEVSPLEKERKDIEAGLIMFFK